jgi:hypothetical protein
MYENAGRCKNAARGAAHVSDDEPIHVTCIGPPAAYAPHQLPPEIQVQYGAWLAACRRIWEASKDPLIIQAAIRHVSFYQQPIEPWLAAAADKALVKGRTKAHVRRQRELAAQMQRWLKVMAIRGVKNWTVQAKRDRTVWNSYVDVQNDTDKGRRLNSRYWILWDTTRRPHLVG